MPSEPRQQRCRRRLRWQHERRGIGLRRLVAAQGLRGAAGGVGLVQPLLHGAEFGEGVGEPGQRPDQAEQGFDVLLVAALAWTAFGLAFYEKSFLLFGIYALVALGWFATGGIGQRLGGLWRDYKLGVVAYAGLALPYLAAYVRWGLDFGGEQPAGSLISEVGYRLVGGNRFGFNACFLRDDLAVDLVPAIGVEELLRHDWNRPARTRPAPPR